MDETERLKAIAARDQLWASLRALLPEISRLAAGNGTDSERDRLLVQVMARIVEAELNYRADEAQDRA